MNDNDVECVGGVSKRGESPEKVYIRYTHEGVHFQLAASPGCENCVDRKWDAGGRDWIGIDDKVLFPEPTNGTLWSKGEKGPLWNPLYGICKAGKEDRVMDGNFFPLRMWEKNSLRNACAEFYQNVTQKR